MQEVQAHPSIVYHQHPHADTRHFSWEDGVLLTALLTLAWVIRPTRRKGKKLHGLERPTLD